MAELPTSLSIAIWLAGSTWLVAIIAHVVGAPHEIVFVAFMVGLCAGLAEWIVFQRHN